MSIVFANDPAITYACPPGALQATWSLRTDGQGGYIMDTRGNGCYMQYSFTGTSINVQIVSNFDHGWYSCMLDNTTPQWFNANAAIATFGAACTLAGASNEKHTITITNGDQPGWALSINNITLSSNASQGVTTFTSVYPPVQVPVAITATTGSSCASTVTATVTSTSNSDTTGSSKHEVSTSALGAVAGVLGVVILMALGAAFLFWRRDRHSREELKWALEMSENRPAPFIAVPPKPPSPSREQQLAAVPYGPWEVAGGSIQPQAPSTLGTSEGSVAIEPSPAYSASTYPGQKRG
ncbi:hypothetical protein FRB97_004662 [Tulasnella sp. 331]|nr:hypothetical protein FRB97_004662 [Tulasnella sp. 331]